MTIARTRQMILTLESRPTVDRSSVPLVLSPTTVSTSPRWGHAHVSCGRAIDCPPCPDHAPAAPQTTTLTTVPNKRPACVSLAFGPNFWFSSLTFSVTGRYSPLLTAAKVGLPAILHCPSSGSTHQPRPAIRDTTMLQNPKNTNARPSDASTNKRMTRVGFEPTHLSILACSTTAEA
jgi:hypothetical protein